jgi:hypothetical protein
MGAARWKYYDYVVMVLFAAVVVGVSLNWYQGSSSVFDRDLVDLTFRGWHYSLGVLSFIAALAALVTVCVKARVAPGDALGRWYTQGSLLVVLGGFVTLFALVRVAMDPVEWDVPFYGHGPGAFVTLGAGLLIVVCGWLALRDKPGAPAGPIAPTPMAAQRPLQTKGGWQLSGRVNAARWRYYDYAIMILFVVVAVGVSLHWYTASEWDRGPDSAFPSAYSGWRYYYGVLAFIAALAALVTVCAKALLSPGERLANWHAHGVLLMVLAVFVVAFSLVHLVQDPGEWDIPGGHPGVGCYVTLAAGLLMIVSGYLSYRDRSPVPA